MVFGRERDALEVLHHLLIGVQCSMRQLRRHSSDRGGELGVGDELGKKRGA